MRSKRFVATLFVSATLLFTFQPLVARMIVPLLGGSPSVWIVCSLCFQALLLAGYCWSHIVGSRLSLRAQVPLQIILVVAAFFALPPAIDESLARYAEDGHPTTGLVLLLLRAAGVPFFVLSTTSPLIQRWFAELGENDPYYLYAASNGGSMIALLGYPFLIEPLLSVGAQRRAVQVGYAAYAVLVVICALTALKKRHPPRVEATPAPPGVSDTPPRGMKLAPPAPKWVERIAWIALAFAPSSLLMGTTEFITTDVASVPLLWVIPLALYLASFIVAFSKKPLVSAKTASWSLALLAALVAASMLADLVRPAWLIVTGHLALLFCASVVCHQVLAARRPHVGRLTEFYLLMSVGGVLGGAFNGLLAPLVFDDLFEYPIAIGFVCAARAFGRAERTTWKDVAYAMCLVVVTLILTRIGGKNPPPMSFVWMFGLPLLVTFAWNQSSVRYAIALAGILIVGTSYGGAAGQVEWRTRGFFGILKVTRDPTGKFRRLIYGKTMHGEQALEPERRMIPLAYYHPTGPAGDVLGPLDETRPARRIGVIGLGIGSVAAYARPFDAWTFFELNPAVVVVAKKHFTFLSDVPESTTVAIEVGDARLRLRQGAAARFDVLVLDAFSSDAVPIHLVTREALDVYRRSMVPHGLLLAHVSNRHVALQPVFAALAKNAGMAAIERKDVDVESDEHESGKETSEWVLLALSTDDLQRFAGTDWKPLVAAPNAAVWTDDFANVLSVMRF